MDAGHICPGCGLDIDFFLKERRKRYLFEKKYADQLRPGRWRISLIFFGLGFMLGLVMCLIGPLFLIMSNLSSSYVYVNLDQASSAALKYLSPTAKAFISIIVAFIVMEYGKSWIKSKEENQLWENFNSE